MQWLLLPIVLVLAAVVAILLLPGGARAARRFGKDSAGESAAPVRAADGELLGLQEPEPVLAPVLLPARPSGADVDALRLAPALRGYRCDQVDGVLDVVAAELDRLGRDNAALRAQLDAALDARASSAGGAAPGGVIGPTAANPE